MEDERELANFFDSPTVRSSCSFLVGFGSSILEHLTSDRQQSVLVRRGGKHIREDVDK
jgi:hypothetical protein